MDWKKIISSGIAFGIIMYVIGSIFGFLTGDMYTLTPALWKDMTGNWMYYMIVFDVIVGIILATIYSFLRKAVPGTGAMKGAIFGFMIWLVGSVTGLGMTYMTMAVSTTLIGAWAFSGLLYYLIGGAALEMIYAKV